MARLRSKNIALLLLAVLALGCGYALVEHLRDFSGERLFAATYSRTLKVFYFPLLELFRNSILTGPFWCVLILTLSLERLAPAKPAQKIFSASFAQDVVWFFYETVLRALIIITFVELLTRLYAKHFSFLTITSLNQSPGWVRFLLALLLVDFLYWGQHYCNHKVPLLWQFHALHHSQKELNFFTDFRYHVLEYIVRYTFLVIPLLILKIDPPVIASLAIFLTWYSRFYHGNIRTNLGPLRYILVTPQSHRVHHSVEPGQRDTNFGAIFSIWDFALGTQCRSYEIYPDTGIDDENFPQEQTVGLKGLLSTPFRQLVYPGLAVWKKRFPAAMMSPGLPKSTQRLPGLSRDQD